MMTGPEHYQEAERLLAAAEAAGKRGGHMDALLKAALVHATLADAAATALSAAAGVGLNGLSAGVQERPLLPGQQEA